jgi:CrcB protein
MDQSVNPSPLKESFDGIRILSIVCFGILGIMIRYVTNVLFKEIFKIETFWSTLIINILGSAIIGFIQAFGVEGKKLNNELRYGITVGLLGGFTTFSGYCLDFILLIEKPDAMSIIIGVLYLVFSPLLGVGACYLSILLTRKYA